MHYQYGLVPFLSWRASNFDWVKVEYDWLDKFKVIYLCYDNDPAEKGAMKKQLKN